MSRTDQQKEIEINFLGRGSLTYLFGGQKIQIPHQSLVVFWAAMPHQVIDFSDLENYYVMTIPLPTFLQFDLPSFFVQQILQGQFLFNIDVTNQCADESHFEQWIADIESEEEKQSAAFHRLVEYKQSTDTKQIFDPERRRCKQRRKNDPVHCRELYKTLKSR
jgi:hypothetical protein